MVLLHNMRPCSTTIYVIHNYETTFPNAFEPLKKS
jgi:hypothetical protein